jgi:hypothetical protein
MEPLTTLRWRKSSRSGPNGGECVEVAPMWRKSSRSGPNGGSCVEVATLPAAVAVRDSKDPNGPKLTLPPADWQSLIESVKTGRYDL